MKKSFVFVTTLSLFLLPSTIFAHSGRTDSSGGHNCSVKSIAKGLCTGYHYHNGGSVSAPVYAPIITARLATSKTATPRPTEAPTTPPTVEPVVLGVSATFEATASPIVSETIESKVAGDKKENPIIGLGILGVLVYGTIKFLGWKEKRLQKIV